MAKFTTFALIGLLLSGCYSGGGGHDSSFICDPADRTGTYLVHYTERANGTCGAWPDEVARLDADAPLAANCTFDAPDEWTEAECKLTRSATCSDATTGVEVNVVAITTQQDASADTLTGLMTLTISQGGDACRSTYDLVATRQ